MNDLTAELKENTLGWGADLIGVADISGLKMPFPRAISVAVALNPEIVETLSEGPSLRYQDEYTSVNGRIDDILNRILRFLSDRGYKAKAETASSPDFDRRTLSASFPHKTAATLGGLGWIGKNALLITEQYGSAVRLGTVFTDAPLDADVPVLESRCGTCSACLQECPVNAPGDRNWQPGMDRGSLVEIEACMGQLSSFMDERGLKHAICGICIRCCPWTERFLRKDRH